MVMASEREEKRRCGLEDGVGLERRKRTRDPVGGGEGAAARPPGAHLDWISPDKKIDTEPYSQDGHHNTHTHTHARPSHHKPISSPSSMKKQKHLTPAPSASDPCDSQTRPSLLL